MRYLIAITGVPMPQPSDNKTHPPTKEMLALLVTCIFIGKFQHDSQQQNINSSDYMSTIMGYCSEFFEDLPRRAPHSTITSQAPSLGRPVFFNPSQPNPGVVSASILLARMGVQQEQLRQHIEGQEERRRDYQTQFTTRQFALMNDMIWQPDFRSRRGTTPSINEDTEIENSEDSESLGPKTD